MRERPELAGALAQIGDAFHSLADLVSAETLQAYTVGETAERMSVHPDTVRHMIGDGRLRAVRVGREWRVPAAELARFLEGGAS